MLINLTNHSYSTWHQEMKNAAISMYGEVIDMPFPTVPAKVDRETIEVLATEYWMKIQEVRLKHDLQKVLLKHDLSPGDVTIHLMGEFTFTYTLLTLLKAAGIPAVASTTERNTIDHPDGSKTVNFSFVRFREYYNIQGDH